MSEERILIESDTKEFVLTTHKVRMKIRWFGQTQVTSIPLVELTSCEIKNITKPWLLFLAGISLLITFGSINEGAVALGISLVVTLLLILSYFLTSYSAISLSSPSASVNMRLKGMAVEDAIDLIEKVEAAKYARSPSENGKT